MKDPASLLYLVVFGACMALLFGCATKRPDITDYSQGGGAVHIGGDTFQAIIEHSEIKEFHIRVAPYGGHGWYVIHFTNDNWQTHEELSRGDNPGLVLFLTKAEAVAYARKFKSYEACVKNNLNVQERYQRKLEADKPVEIY